MWDEVGLPAAGLALHHAAGGRSDPVPGVRTVCLCRAGVFQMHGDEADPPPYRPNPVLRGPRHLPVALAGVRCAEDRRTRGTTGLVESVS
ncbi:hypothetical protein GCM10022255_068250 [Dactylosporangium darangshiense]|uniref:Sulfatase-modifying factor enzyme domain-containing protein n=1 Tax=Dactylosporangium darangshiense TaxID=579108 RepID=A0ABP8DHK6_9ACTN